MEVGTTFCRFCAEFKPFGKLYNLQSNVSICKEIELKVQFIQADFINLRVEGNYPATVCFVCKEALDQVYIFFKKVKKAQEIVGDLLNNPELFRIASEQSTCIKSESPTDILPEKGIPEIPEEVIPEDDFSEFESFDTKQENDNDDTTSEKSLPEIKKYKRNIKTDDTLKPKSWNHMRWICDHCNNEFSDIQSLRTHSKSTHNICRAFKCPECTTYQGAKSFNGFIRHVRKHYVHLRKFCIHCNKSCATAPRLIFHLQDHLADKSSCGYCGDIFNDAIELQEHLNLYSLRQRNPKRPGEGNDISDRTCKVCHKVFQSTAYIPDHMLIHQGKRRIYTCDRCGKSFKSKGSLVYHLKSYNEEKKFSCKICDKSFSVRSRLVQHIIRHSDVKKFKCEECGKKFKIGRQLKEHRLVHTNYMPFSCEVCAKQFRRKNNLKKHLLQHTGEKPYSCEVCDKTFTDVGNRNKHMKRVHNKDVARRLEVIEESAGDIEKWKESLTLEKYIRRL